MTMPAHAPHKPATISGGNAINLAAAAERTLEHVQLARLSSRLQHVSNSSAIARAFGGNPDQYAATLARQYTDLAAKLRGTDIVSKAPADRVSARLNQIATLFGWWQSVQAPLATVQLVSTPPGADPQEEGIGAEIFPGYLSIGGVVDNPTSSNPNDEAWWVNTWQYIIPLPVTSSNAPAGARMAYRFNVGASLGFYGEPAVSGSVHAYATVATTPDLAGHPIDYNHYVSSQFAINANLPIPTVPEIVGGTAAFTGSITLTPGKTPAIGILIGLIFGVGGAEQLRVIPGEFSNITLAPPDATSPADLGKIEIRTDLPFWVEAVTKMSAAS